MTRATATDIAYVVYRHDDLDRQAAFLADFGLIALDRGGTERRYRGYGDAPCCYVDLHAEHGGQPGLATVGLTASSRADLDAAAAHPDAVGPVSPLRETWGGGEKVSLRDPDGLTVDLVWGRSSSGPVASPPPLIINHACSKSRLGITQRLTAAPPAVHRLGHLALLSRSVPARAAWYKDAFGMLLSDGIREPDERLSGAFLRCDRADEWTDHHTIAIFETHGTATVHHSSFELTDLDALAAGAHWMRARGREAEWGIGRHVLGSQIFNYWIDPEGVRIEHFTDGDMFTASKEEEYHPASLDTLYQWGPEVPIQWLP